MKLFKYRSLQILFLVGIYFFVAPICPLWVHQGLYTISVLIKDLLLWMLPMTVAFFIAHAVASFEKKAPLFVLMLFLFEGLSNMTSVWYAYGCAGLVSGYVSFEAAPKFDDSFKPLWHLGFSVLG